MKKGEMIKISENINKIKRKETELENRHNLTKFSEIDFLKNYQEDSNQKSENFNNNGSKNKEQKQIHFEEDKEFENELNSNNMIVKNQNPELKKDLIFISDIEPKIGNTTTKGLINLPSLKEAESHLIVFGDYYDLNASRLFFSIKKKTIYFPLLGLLSIFSLREASEIEEGFQFIQNLQKKGQIPKVIIAANEFYFSNLIEEMHKKKISIGSIYFAILPFGVKNDLAFATRWGHNSEALFINDNIEECLKNLLNELQRATIELINFFEVDLKCRTIDDIEKMKKNKEKAVFENVSSYKLKKLFCGNLSIGFEARVNGEIERKMWDKDCCKCGGFTNGFIRHICDDSINICDIIDRIEKTHLISDSSNVENYIFSSKTESSPNSKFIQGNPSVILFTNIGSFLGGNSKPWEKCSSQLGIGFHRDFNITFKDQKMSDNLLEGVTYENKCALCKENFFSRNSMRLCQAENYCIIFKIQEDPPIKTYLCIDEEYYRVKNPLIMNISNWEHNPKGKVHILMKNSMPN